MRKLASIQKIINIDPIEGKDKIVLASILGWSVIIQKDQFNIGDLCVYIETDSILPEKEWFEFLRSRCWSAKNNGFRIKCMKMGFVYSQGIVFPLNIPPIIGKNLKEGDDVTDLLQIRKYDPEAEKINITQYHKKKSVNAVIKFLCKYSLTRWIVPFKWRKKSYSFPVDLIQKTDETRIQAVPFIIDEYKEEMCYITEKLDGCSASYVWRGNEFLVCSRNIVFPDMKLYYEIEKKYDIKNKLKNQKRFAIQGEIIGQGIANGCGKNLYEIKGLDFYVYNIVDTKKRKILGINELSEFCYDNELKSVPILDLYYRLGSESIQELEIKSIGKSLINPATEREGIVIRDIENKKRSIRGLGEGLSFKVINPEFLIKYNL